ncbi:MAG: thiamine pyrophosphate-binding protein [Betaproteobacteria bacterium]|nr:MAG: thiamine pyrophosphate-binding protein [Betaproteobacteria bacterium]
MKIAEFLLQTLECCGVRAIFGNPGTTEIPLVRMCEGRERLRYVVALSEVAAVPMADGYARAARSLGAVNLHVAPGLGNGMGALYTAGIAKTPLLVLIGGQDRRLLHTSPILYGPLEAMAGSVCKTVIRLDSMHDAAANVRNAIRAALTPPFRPVALICPPDLLEEETDATPTAVSPPRLCGLDDAAAVQIAGLIAQSRNPALIAAEDVHWHGAETELRALAESLDAPVYVAPYTGVLPVDASSRAYGGYLSPGFGGISDRLAAHDLLLFIGGRTLRTTLHSELRLAQVKCWLGDDPSVLPLAGEFHAAHLVDLRQALASVRLALTRQRSRSPADPRHWRPAIELPPAGAGFHPTLAITALLEAFPDAIVVDEAGLSTSDIRQWMHCNAGEYIINGSGGIGWGLAASVGAAIALPERQVVCVVGDGSSLYASESLWTAANRETRLLSVVLSNRRYATLNQAAAKLTGHDLDLFSIEPPVIDFSGLARLYGLEFVRARTQDELAAALHGLRGGLRRNTLLELVFGNELSPVTASRHF